MQISFRKKQERSNKQQTNDITPVKTKTRVRKLVNWNVPESDGVHGY